MPLDAALVLTLLDPVSAVRNRLLDFGLGQTAALGGRIGRRSSLRWLLGLLGWFLVHQRVLLAAAEDACLAAEAG